MLNPSIIFTALCFSAKGCHYFISTWVGLEVVWRMEELYTLEKEVGRGSYGVVFEGHMAKTGQRVAVKRLPCSNPECIELYLQELWAMRSTAKNHVNVIALHDCLLQTGPRSLKPLRAGKLPLRLVESVLKGSVVGAQQIQEEESNSDENTQRRSNSVCRLQDRTNTIQARVKHQDKSSGCNISNATTPQRPQNRGRKRPAQRREDQPGPNRCLALWLVMEYCDGGDLNQYLLSRPPDTRRNHTVVKQLCSAVAFLHSLGITHRDLKPDNVLVCMTPKGPVVKVTWLLSQFSHSLSCFILEPLQNKTHTVPKYFISGKSSYKFWTRYNKINIK